MYSSIIFFVFPAVYTPFDFDLQTVGSGANLLCADEKRFSVLFQRFDIFQHFGNRPPGVFVLALDMLHIFDTVRPHAVYVYAFVHLLRGASVPAEKIFKRFHVLSFPQVLPPAVGLF